MIPYYKRNGITIYCGDCLKIMLQLDPYYDAIIADWPYGTTACAWDSVIPLDRLWPECKRLIKDNGAIVLTGSQPFTSKLVMSNIDWFKYEWVWNKPRGHGFQIVAHRPLVSHESICVFGKKAINYYPQMKLKDKPRLMTNAGSTKQMLVSNGIPYKAKKESTHSYPTTSLFYSNENNRDKEHPTQKPVALMSYLIRTYTNSKEIILDNTMGSGTTLVAAQNEGRRATGIELSEEYCKIAVKRLKQPSFFSISDEPKVEIKQSSFKDD